MNLGKPFLLGAFGAFLGLLVCAEILLRWAAPSGLWYSHFDPAGEMTSLAELKARVQAAFQPGAKPLLVLGDSVLGATALLEHRIPEARDKTLYHSLKKELQADGRGILSLGSDGLLLPDLEALQAEALPFSPERVLLLLNFRMFAREFTEGPQALSRKFLLPNLPPATLERVKTASKPSQESMLGDFLYGKFCEHWFLFRQAQALKAFWFTPSRKDFLQRNLERITGRDDSQDDIQEAALKQKTATYYQAPAWKTDSLPFTCLGRILSQWTSAAEVTLVLTPQNADFLGPQLDRKIFEKNLGTLKEFLKKDHPGVRYLDWAGRYPPSLFLDHCHLNPEGNRRYAEDLKGLIAGMAKP